jgi:hypothetical protein
VEENTNENKLEKVAAQIIALIKEAGLSYEEAETLRMGLRQRLAASAKFTD